MIVFYSIRSNLINDILRKARVTDRTLTNEEIVEMFPRIKHSLAPYINYCMVTIDEVNGKLKISEETYNKKELSIKIKVFDGKSAPIVKFLDKFPEFVGKSTFKNFCKECGFKDYSEANQCYDNYVEIHEKISSLYNDGNYDVVIIKATQGYEDCK